MGKEERNIVQELLSNFAGPNVRGSTAASRLARKFSEMEDAAGGLPAVGRLAHLVRSWKLREG